MPDTIWCSDFPDTEPPTLTQGLGITGTFFSSCYGAIINGVTYGTVSVEDETEILPEHFYLSQNYPNPFNPETVIRFTLPAAGYSKGVVYDVLGKEVTTLLNGDMSAGNHEVRFNAKISRQEFIFSDWNQAITHLLSRWWWGSKYLSTLESPSTRTELQNF
ncbi:MAG: hypothetical protein IPN18_13720 [Ignavibacteriales bacterium]|nr:hypothetical protein [Ignavibacteriales bacterium]